GRREKLAQGVTTEVVGNCGFSAHPPSPDPRELRAFANGILSGGDTWGWPSSRAYLEAASASPVAHVCSLVGHGSLRVAVAGMRLGPLPESDIARMEDLLDTALCAGAVGFSTGLMYAPGSSAPTEELERMCRIVARRNKVYTSHMRSYFHDLVPAIREQVELARRTGCKLQISHLQAVGAANWPQHELALAEIERARQDGVDVMFDCYPYTAGSTVLTQLLPQETLDGGIDALMSRLSDAALRAEIRSRIESTIPWSWKAIYITAPGSAENRALVGSTLAEIGNQLGMEPAEAVLHLLVAEHGDVNMLCFNQSEANLRLSLTHPLSVIGSDGFYVKGRPHPRLYGTFPFLLGEVCRNRGWLTLEAAIHKITLKTAVQFGIEGRGHITAGAVADITALSPDLIDTPATYEEPEQSPSGIHWVLRSGELAHGSFERWQNGTHGLA
ncbi:MAG TPA: amidohydrolase family protein, partial [Bryobacteraceae bacterium]|nr:amidohydrolase family protein [Bryobacteraceae bacterium]